MFVHDYGNDCPSANKRSVFVSYLDSVPFSAYPRRGDLYLEVLIAYLKDAGRRGFEFAYFWAAPPRNNGSYILNVRPTSMKMPNDEALVRWYTNGLKLALERGYIAGYGNLFERIGNEPKKVAQRLPYLPGFLWPDKAETIFEENWRSRRRRRRLLPGWRVPGAPKEVRDLPSTEGNAPEPVASSPAATEARGTCDVTVEPEALRDEKGAAVLPSSSAGAGTTNGGGGSASAVMPCAVGGGAAAWGGPRGSGGSTAGTEQADASGPGGDGALGGDAAQQGPNKERKVADGSDADSGGCDPVVLKLMKTVERYKDSLFDATLSSGKAGNEEQEDLYSKTIGEGGGGSKGDGKPYAEMLKTRDAFLGWCRSQNYQFGTLARAKHSSLMILHDIHNEEKK
ncbi:conserved unknown protein [Ectocarpus siliculosus]|uniref:histone acetyltransferase n=1 Tax=Ectocarpus siliculosus TaxID=2880 RepID=D7FGQ7_ECTSI|nr:conserved unknown protein [Ectocarpus siliculosus]|eukprot:CBJ28333.1 conserved unknown protein [Ectocarpus siliculosus]